jgi:hypothetical protein
MQMTHQARAQGWERSLQAAWQAWQVLQQVQRGLRA